MIQTAAMIGMGAIGTVYGHRLFQQYGSRFRVAAGGDREERIRGNGLQLNGETFYPAVIHAASAEFAPDLLILCVKNHQLVQAFPLIRACLAPHTIILPLLNGVTARDVLQKGFPGQTVFYGLSMGIDAVRSAAGVVNRTDGMIQFGYRDNRIPAPEVTAVRDYLAAAGIDARIMPDMVHAAWKKWMLNVGLNQVSALTGAQYGHISAIPEIHTLFVDAMEEALAVAQAKGIPLSHRDLEELDHMMETFPKIGKTSLLQDVEAGRDTEAGCFAGTVLDLGREYGIPTPVNRVFFNLIKAREGIRRTPLE